MKLYAQNETPRRGFPYIRKPTASPRLEKGPMAEWLGSALQKLLQRFESASDLQPQKAPSKCLGFFCARNLRPSSLESEAKGKKNSKRASRRA